MKALVVGATGAIGASVSELLEEKGYEVIKASRHSTPKLDMTSRESIEKFYAQLGEVDAILCTAGEAAFNSLEEVTDEEIALGLKSKLLGQVNLVRMGLHHLKPRGAFVLTGGLLAYSPMPKSAMISMVNAGLEGFARAVALELTEGRRIVVVHPAWVAETAAKLGMDARPWPSAKKTAHAYWKALQSRKNGEPVFLDRFTPSEKWEE